MYAINSNSKNKRAAWEFIKILASMEVQSQVNKAWIPINKNALEKAHRIPDKFKEAYNEYFACIDKYAGMVNTYTLRDSRFDQMLSEEAALYFSGVKSAKDTAAALQNKANLYFSE